MPSTVIAAMHYDAANHILTIVYRGKRGVYHYFISKFRRNMLPFVPLLPKDPI